MKKILVLIICCMIPILGCKKDSEYRMALTDIVAPVSASDPIKFKKQNNGKKVKLLYFNLGGNSYKVQVNDLSQNAITVLNPTNGVGVWELQGSTDSYEVRVFKSDLATSLNSVLNSYQSTAQSDQTRPFIGLSHFTDSSVNPSDGVVVILMEDNQ